MILFLENVEPLYVVASFLLEVDPFNEIRPADVIPLAIPMLIAYNLVTNAMYILNDRNLTGGINFVANFFDASTNRLGRSL